MVRYGLDLILGIKWSQNVIKALGSELHRVD